MWRHNDDIPVLGGKNACVKISRSTSCPWNKTTIPIHLHGKNLKLSPHKSCEESCHPWDLGWWAKESEIRRKRAGLWCEVTLTHSMIDVSTTWWTWDSDGRLVAVFWISARSTKHRSCSNLNTSEYLLATQRWRPGWSHEVWHQMHNSIWSSVIALASKATS